MGLTLVVLTFVFIFLALLMDLNDFDKLASMFAILVFICLVIIIIQTIIK